MNEPVPHEVLDDLVQIVTHRIASLTAGVEGYTDVLVETLNTPEQRRLARHILEGVSRINGVMEDLRFYVRPIQPVSVAMRLSNLLESALAILTDAERSLVSIVDPESTHLLVQADPHLSRQALHALLRNALDAAGPAGAVRIDVRANASAQAIVRIWNGGSRMTASEAARAMEPFYTTRAQNLGLGLTLARRMTQAQGGDVEFEDAVDGTAVLLRLPLTVAQEA